MLLTFLLSVPLAALEASDLPPHPFFPTEAESMGKFLCERIDLCHPGLESVRKEAEAGRYAAALEAWRDWKVRQLRLINPGAYSWHGDQLSAKYRDFAEVLVGRMKPEQAARETVWAAFEDLYGLRGPVDQPLKTDWLAKDKSGSYSSNYAGFSIGNGLVVRYWQTGDPVYLKKWFQIAGDFACNQKRAVEALEPGTRRSVPCNWLASDAGGALAQADRVKIFIRSLAGLCKSLPDGDKPAQWATVYNPLPAPLPESSVALIPAVELAQVALSLVIDHPPALLQRYEKAGSVPNQRQSGLGGLLLTAATFPEFTASRELMEKAGAAFSDYMAGGFHADGGMLEQSFNYNIGAARDLGDIADWVRVRLPELATDLDSRKRGFCRLAASLSSPLVSLPGMSSYSSMNPPPVWKDQKARTKWMAEQTAKMAGSEDSLVAGIAGQFSENPLQPPPAFTSVAFPYSGYCAQRLNWQWNSPYLFLQTSRRARGHSTLGCNSIQVVAFGRPMLVMAGPPVYSASQLREDLRPDFLAINELLGEQSSLKANTVLVDGSSQSRLAPEAQMAPTNPISTRWHTSSLFDFAEGLYEDGYPQKSVSHRRQVIFIRNPGFWIVTDLMLNNDQREHAFTQLWNFPGYREHVKTPAYGFTEEQVVLDAASRGVHTADPEGPNLWLAHCGGGALEYVKYFGNKNPYRGWFSPGFGDLIPAPQVMVNWKAAHGSSVLVTVIWPTPDRQPPGFKLRDTSPTADHEQAGFQMVLPDGTTLGYQAAHPARSLTTESFATTAETLLSVKTPDGTVRVLVLGCKGQGSEDCEFRWDGREAKEVLPIQRTRGFLWREAPGGMKPEYAGQ